MSNGDGIAWLGFWLMLGLWNVNLDINFENKNLVDFIINKELIDYIEGKEAELVEAPESTELTKEG